MVHAVSMCSCAVSLSVCGRPRCALPLRRPHDAGHEARDGAEERRRQVDPVADEVVGDEREGGDVEGDAERQGRARGEVAQRRRLEERLRDEQEALAEEEDGGGAHPVAWHRQRELVLVEAGRRTEGCEGGEGGRQPRAGERLVAAALEHRVHLQVPAAAPELARTAGFEDRVVEAVDRVVALREDEDRAQREEEGEEEVDEDGAAQVVANAHQSSGERPAHAARLADRRGRPKPKRLNRADKGRSGRVSRAELGELRLQLAGRRPQRPTVPVARVDVGRHVEDPLGEAGGGADRRGAHAPLDGAEEAPSEGGRCEEGAELRVGVRASPPREERLPGDKRA
mmetsp:Transcript_11620/g.34221  ORF Transcript_11620/g.34221 Transcript_11620/m.34221 type:complete len:341 (-) Transcript_11620:4-1026(-)